MKKERIPIIIAGIFIILSVIGVGSGVYFYRQYKVSEEKLKNPEGTAKKESKDLVAKVSKLMVLPSEEAQIATVSDVENLKKSQLFFLDANNNDKVLIFPQAKKAVLYRPSTNMIINVAPILDSPQSTVSGQQGQSLKIALRNGTGTVGVTAKLEEELKTKLQNYTIIEKDNAQQRNYEKTVVISLSDALNKTLVQQLANELSASVSSLPSGEPKPEADILIIAGKDRQ